jgi:hypothetical protein
MAQLFRKSLAPSFIHMGPFGKEMGVRIDRGYPFSLIIQKGNPSPFRELLEEFPVCLGAVERVKSHPYLPN